jgi:hypothetical protein
MVTQPTPRDVSTLVLRRRPVRTARRGRKRLRALRSLRTGDDATPLRLPGAGYGYEVNGTGDLNCDGKTEMRYEALHITFFRGPGSDAM